MKLEEIQPGKVIAGIVPGKVARVVAAEMRGADELELTYRVDGSLGQRRLSRADEDGLLPASDRAWWLRPSPGLLALLLAATLVLAVVRFWPHPNSTKEGAPADDFPVVIRTNGGMLEVATIRYRRTFPISQVLVVAGITVPFCKANATYTLDTYITYRVRLAKYWASLYHDQRLEVIAPKLEPALPVAFDTTRLKSTLEKCPLMPGGTQEDLLKTISGKLAQDASSPQYIQLARNNGARETVREFARRWLIGQKTYHIPANTPIDVQFEDE